MDSEILLNHGSGGLLTSKLIKEVFYKHLGNEILNMGTDSAVLTLSSGEIAVTTDSFVVSPINFPGGDIGKLAVCGTVNDLAVSGAQPLYLTAGFIIEEGFPVAMLEDIVKSMAEAAKEAGVTIVAGDTKVVEKGKCDGLYINTSGIGSVYPQAVSISSGILIEPGDAVIINGTIADHGMAVLKERNSLNIESDVVSDCAPLNNMIALLEPYLSEIKFMRDATRGGVATVLNEIAQITGLGINVYENKIPINPVTSDMCEMFGFDPLYVANEGKVIIISSPDAAQQITDTLKTNRYGINTAIIGVVNDKKRVTIETGIGGKRVIEMLYGEQLPRIC